MEIHGNTWKYVEIRGNTWKYMEIHGNTWKYRLLQLAAFPVAGVMEEGMLFVRSPGIIYLFYSAVKNYFILQ